MSETYEYPTFISRTFPKVPKIEIWRENLLNTIQTTFEGDVDVLFLDGTEGIGKTTLASQFARSFEKQTLSLFIRNVSKLAYDPFVLKLDLCQQIYFLLNKGELPNPDSIDDGFLRTLIYRLQREIHRSQQSIYIILDGLDEVPKSEHETMQLMLDLLPWSFRGFKFMVSGDAKVLPGIALNQIYHKSFRNR